MKRKNPETGADRKRSGGFVSFRLAVTVISLLFGASLAGWILTELVPYDFPSRADLYGERWGGTTVDIFMWLKLYDPFHSFWFSGILALFFVVLLLCLLTGWKGVLYRTLRIVPPRSEKEIGSRKPILEISWHDIACKSYDRKDPVEYYSAEYGRSVEISGEETLRIFESVSSLLKRKRYRIVSSLEGKTVFFAAVAGRWRYAGNFIFHLALLVITAGGIIGSFMGSSELMYGKQGDILPLYSSEYSVLVESFRIFTTTGMQISDYVSRLSVIDSRGDTVRTGDIEVNHPMRFKGFSILQSSYYVDEKDFAWARIECISRDAPAPVSLTLEPGSTARIEGDSCSISVERFFPDFRIRSEGPYSASATMSNPAVEISVSRPEGEERGWLFLAHPAFNSNFPGFSRITLKEIEPRYYTGLLIRTNPGAPVFIAGIIMASIGILMLYFTRYRRILGRIDHRGLVVRGLAGMWAYGMERELEAMERKISVDASRIISGGLNQGGSG